MTPQIAALAVARDALLEERFDACRAVLDEHDVDVEYVRCSAKRAHPRFYVDEGDPYEDEPLPLDEQRRLQRAEWSRIDWQAWKRTARNISTEAFDGILRELYLAESLAGLRIAADPDAPLDRIYKIADVRGPCAALPRAQCSRPRRGPRPSRRRSHHHDARLQRRVSHPRGEH